MTPTSNFTERFFNLFYQRPFAVFFRIFILVYAMQRQEFIYILLFAMAACMWMIESIALYLDPKLYTGKLIGLANILFFILVMSLALTHIAPIVVYDLELLTGK